MYNTYYQEELAFLREMGREFAAENPKVAHMLETADADPDVERILQGVAFLTGRLRQKVDDEIPELFQSLMSLLWPHYLRPVPSTAIVQFMRILPAPDPPAVREAPYHRRPAALEDHPRDGGFGHER